jgi:hypothetical protein
VEKDAFGRSPLAGVWAHEATRSLAKSFMVMDTFITPALNFKHIGIQPTKKTLW